MPESVRLARRSVLRLALGAGGALTAHFVLPGGNPRASTADAAADAPVNAEGSTATTFADGWLIIHPDNRVVFRVASAEMGQGVMTSMPALIAEELEVDWDTVETEMAPVGDGFRNLAFNMQATGGSTSIRWSFNVLRQVGARVRETLKLAAANRWSAPVVECRAERGHVVHAPSGERLSYGELAGEAAGLTPPDNVPFKPHSNWQLLGRDLPRVDSQAKSTGAAGYGLDVRVEGMLTGAITMCPVFGGRLDYVDERPALAVRGVHSVLKLPTAVIVLADGYWPAHQGLAAIEPKWDAGRAARNSTARIEAALKAGLERDGAVAERNGDAHAAINGAGQQFSAEYTAPLLAHATMEPMNATAHVRADGADIWAGTQATGAVPSAVAEATGLDPASVKVHTMFLGGGFGRRFEMDFIVQAALASKLAGRPVKLVWSRADDTRHDYYRPAAAARMRAGLTDGRIAGLTARVCSPSIMSRVFPGAVVNGLDMSAVEGLVDTPYALPTVDIDYVLEDIGVPVGFWRAVGHSHNAFFVESFVDELADAASADPVDFRLAMLDGQPRHQTVLKRVAEISGWHASSPEPGSGRARGVALAESFGSIVAQVVEVTVDGNAVDIHSVSCVVDCGIALNPAEIRAQIESSVAYGLSAALYGQITIEEGRVVESNFHDYPVLRAPQMPPVTTVILEGEPGRPGGIGEPGLPPLAPALANAIFRASGQRLRELPFARAGLRLS